MKTFFLFLFFILSFVSYSQTKFYSEADVLSYLNNKRNFTNSGTGVTLIFTEMGGRMTSNKGLNYFSPDVTLVNTTRAVVAYTSLTSGGKAQIIVDCSENAVLDRSSGVAYFTERLESSRRNDNSDVQVDRSLTTPKANGQILKKSEVLTDKNIKNAKMTVKSVAYNVGEVKVIGNLQISEFDFETKIAQDRVKTICLSLGNGWRLPTADELQSLLSNNFKELNFKDGGKYWTSTKLKNQKVVVLSSDSMGFVYNGGKLNIKDLAYLRLVKNAN